MSGSHARSNGTFGRPRIHEDLKEAGVRVAAKRVGSFFATLECELLDRRPLGTQGGGTARGVRVHRGWYNTRRRHSAIGQLSLLEFENREPRCDPVRADLRAGGLRAAEASRAGVAFGAARLRPPRWTRIRINISRTEDWSTVTVYEPSTIHENCSGDDVPTPVPFIPHEVRD